jgi:uncharacterized protein (DUF488 family)
LARCLPHEKGIGLDRNLPKSKLISIGVYGFTESSFFAALKESNVDTFCDLRQRRGVRGSQYAFVNSQRLQEKLREMDIRYIHVRELAPTEAIRNKQKEEDNRLGVLKRERNTLGPAFIDAYRQGCLADFNTSEFLTTLGPSATVICFFCVEREPLACHRSLVIQQLVQDLGFETKDILP